MARCTKCESFTIANFRNGDTHVKLHDSLLLLKTLAEQSCNFCSLCWLSLHQNNSPAQADLHLMTDLSIWLHGWLTDKKNN